MRLKTAPTLILKEMTRHILLSGFAADFVLPPTARCS